MTSNDIFAFKSSQANLECFFSSKILETKDVSVEKPAVIISKETFPDRAFRRYIYRRIRKGSSDILTWDDIKNVIMIDVDNRRISDLKGIEYFTNLKTLYCCNNNLTSLDISKNIALKYLFCHHNNITSLDVSKNTELIELICYDNKLTSLDISKNINLTKLDCDYNKLTSLDISKNINLTKLNCDYNELTSLSISKNINLIKLGLRLYQKKKSYKCK